MTEVRFFFPSEEGAEKNVEAGVQRGRGTEKVNLEKCVLQFGKKNIQ